MHTSPRQLKEILQKHSGRSSNGHVTVRHQGGRQKRYYRMIDFKRDKTGISARVVNLEYDPNRTAGVALLQYEDGEKRYILAPHGLGVGDTILSSNATDAKVGNALPLSAIPIGTQVHAIELSPGKGAKLARSAGVTATILAKEGEFVHVKLGSGEIRKINAKCRAVIGQVGNIDKRHQKIGTAGRARRLGKRPEVRGVAQNPRTHPHGGGEGRSGIGFSSPKSPWGKRTLGKKTRKPGKFSNALIVQKRK